MHIGIGAGYDIRRELQIAVGETVRGEGRGGWSGTEEREGADNTREAGSGVCCNERQTDARHLRRGSTTDIIAARQPTRLRLDLRLWLQRTYRSPSYFSPLGPMCWCARARSKEC
jgi:hypothetical protein